MKISILPAEVASRIAAGEVVERPASIVKELVENSLDAGATRISVEIGNGGISLIRVSDNGCGIDAEELALAFARHATSKLRDEADLQSIKTLGFRGEALPSIAAIAEVEAISRTADAPGGVRVIYQFGELVTQGAAGASPGTTITVRELFREVPARLKFLRSPGSEASQIASVVSHYALAYPEVAFSLQVDGRLTFSTSGSNSRREAAAGVYGASVGQALIEAGQAGEEGWDLRALLAPPSLSRASRNYVTIFINRRWVRSRSLTYAVEEAYAGLMQTGRFPLAVIDLSLPPEEVDVNVHPAKAEVRLRNDRQVFSFLQRPVRQALAGMSPPNYAEGGAWRYREPLLTATPVSRPPLLFQTASADQRLPFLAAPATGQSGQAVLPARVPILRPLGQAGTTYIIAEGPEGLYLIDQHAAHERVLFEKFAALRLASSLPAQQLLAPISLELTPSQRHLVSVHEQALSKHGFVVEDFGDGGYLLRAAPPDLRSDDPSRAFVELLDLMTREDSPTDNDSRIAASLACYAAVRAGKTLSLEEMRDLLEQLEACELPQTCPHGRPTMLHLSADELAKRFSRK